MIKRGNIEDAYRLLPMQQGMLFHSLSAPHSGVYVQQVVCRLSRDINIPAFERAWQRVIERHEVLRTSFHWEGMQAPLQQVHKQVFMPIETQDWRGIAAAEQEKELETYLLQDRSLGFDLTTPPLMRLTLLRLQDGEHLFVWTFHHILLDGRARLIVLKEVSCFYEADCHGQDMELPVAPAYKDYVEWFYRQDVEGEEEYWQQQLRTFKSPVSLALPVEASQVCASDRYKTLEIRLPSALKANLQSVAQRHRVTLNIVVQSVWALLLSRYSGQQDIVFGETRSCRRPVFDGATSVVGVLINTLPIRMQVDQTRPFVGLLEDLRAQHIDLRKYERTPLSNMREWSGIPNESQLFESLVVFEEHTLDSALRREGCSLWQNGVRRFGPTHYPLTLVAWSKPDLLLQLNYDCSIIDAPVAQRMAGHLQELLEGVAANSVVRVGEIEMMSKEEREEVIQGWNDTRREYGEGRCVHEIFEQEVDRGADKVAVIFDDQQLTYGELNRRANHLAHRLRELGVGAEARVGIYVERSLEMVVGLIGIMKAGGVYVPLDASYPQERLRYILEDTKALVVLTQRELREGVEWAGVEVLELDSEEESKDEEVRRGENVSNETGSGNAAYVIYTSGSTGEPKGVEIPHRGVVRLISGDFAQLDNNQILLQFAPINFDASTLEIWGALLNGGTCVLFNGDVATSGALGSVLRQHNVTTAWLTSSLFNAIIDEAPEELASVRQLLVGGEALSVPHIRRALKHLAETQLINGYGPTESTTFTCTYPIVSQGVEGPSSIPIGRPIGNTQVYILDRFLQPVPVAVAGELYIGGAGLARGYLNRPELTAEKFVPNPFSSAPGERLYRTGDIVRWQPDGNIEFLGRVDNQVKIRGYRIEPGEIEAVLRQHPEVEQAVVTVKQEADGDKRLVGYVVSRHEPGPSAEQLRGYLKGKLPEYMVPSFWVMMEQMPLTGSGKVDRKGLPEPEIVSGGGEEYREAKTPTEELVGGIWEEVLKVGRVGRKESFFEIGGHSLLAMQVVSRVKQIFQIEIPLSALFQHATVAELARRIEQEVKVGSEAQVPPIRHVMHKGEIPLSYEQQRLYFVQQLESDSWHYNIPYALRMTGTLEVQPLERALAEIITRHEVLRTTFSLVDGNPVQIVGPPQQLILPLLDLTSLSQSEAERELRRLLDDQARQLFDLMRGPVVRACLVRLQSREHVLALTMHHIVSDAWSMEVMARELGLLYDAFAQGKESPLPKLSIQYADYAVWQREWLQGEVVERQLGYWKQRLAGAPVLELPSLGPRPGQLTQEGGKVRLRIGEQVTRGLRELSRREGVTLFMTVMAGYVVLLHRYSGQEDIVVGTPISGRRRLETEELMGMFLNMLAMRIDVTGNPRFVELMRRVRQEALGGYGNQDVPYDKVVEQVQRERDNSRTPLIQASLVVQHEARQQWELGGMRLSSEEVDTGRTKFDMSLIVKEEGEEMEVVLQYRKQMYEEWMVERMVRQLERVMEAVVKDEEARVGEIEMMSKEEREEVIQGWNDTRREYGESRCVHEIFEQEVDRGADKVAVIFDDQQLTYGELNARANQLANYLRKLGVGPETRVGICMERSVEVFVSLLGILKAGGAYVPLDPAYPKERLLFIIQDAQIAVLIKKRHPFSDLAEQSDRVLYIDSEWSAIARESEENLFNLAGPEDLAYVIYTSGSTGQPKGVMIQHWSAINLAAGLRESVYAEQQLPLRVSVNAPLIFDASVKQLLQLLSGHTLCLVPEEEHVNTSAMLNYIKQSGLGVLDCTPSLLKPLLAAGLLNESGSTLKLVLVGGEAVDDMTWAALTESKTTSFYNVYGPTECTVDTTVCRVQKSLARPAIGRPIANVNLYILDKHLSPVPVGIPGELHVGGAGLARGYLNRPDLTSEKFIPNPFSCVAGARLYKTGDLARYLPDGHIEFLGRKDHQVKIRGYRIELGEIESVLAQNSDIREVAVIAREDRPGDKRLVAYIVPHDDAEKDFSGLRDNLKEKLPEYMVPSAFVTLKSFPLTSSGKLDQRTLPSPDRNSATLNKIYVAPRNPLEEALAAIWAQVLGFGRVGVLDNFFELGGHSLLAMQVISRMRESLDIELPLRILFEEPTIENMASLIANDQVDERIVTSPPIQSVGIQQHSLLANLDQASEETLDALLNELLQEQSY